MSKYTKTVKQLCSRLLGGVQGRSPIDGNLSILYLSLHRHRPNPKNALARFREPGGGPPPSSEGGEVNSANNVLLTYILAFSSILSMFALASCPPQSSELSPSPFDEKAGTESLTLVIQSHFDVFDILIHRKRSPFPLLGKVKWFVR